MRTPLLSLNKPPPSLWSNSGQARAIAPPYRPRGPPAIIQLGHQFHHQANCSSDHDRRKASRRRRAKGRYIGKQHMFRAMGARRSVKMKAGMYGAVKQLANCSLAHTPRTSDVQRHNGGRSRLDRRRIQNSDVLERVSIDHCMSLSSID
jgi:hypothetical protein